MRSNADIRMLVATEYQWTRGKMGANIEGNYPSDRALSGLEEGFPIIDPFDIGRSISLSRELSIISAARRSFRMTANRQKPSADYRAAIYFPLCETPLVDFSAIVSLRSVIIYQSCDCYHTSRCI